MVTENSKCKYVSEPYDNLGAAQEFAKSKNLSTRIISHGDLREMQEKAQRKKFEEDNVGGGIGIDIIC